VSTLASPGVIAQMVGELATLYGETKAPGDPVRPVRLPPRVTALPGRRASGTP
jgi:hypothetical protein